MISVEKMLRDLALAARALTNRIDKDLDYEEQEKISTSVWELKHLLEKAEYFLAEE